MPKINCKEQSSFTDFPSWHGDDLPKPQAILTLSWEDIWEYAQRESLEKFNRLPTRDEISAIFDQITESDWDCEYSTFWQQVEDQTKKFYKNLEEGDF